MNTLKGLAKSFAVGIIVLFFTMSVIPSIEAVNIVIEKNTYAEKPSTSIHKLSNIVNIQPSPVIKGTKGENGWYISCVTITFTTNPEVDEIWYRIGDGNYIKYNTPIVFCEDGRHTLLWYWIDIGGTQWQGPSAFFRIDQTSPTIQLTRKFGLNDKVTFTANCNDDTSEVERVEFYLDDELVETYTEAPYKWIWTGSEGHKVYAIGYNFAGLSIKSNTLSTPRSFSCHFQFINIVFQRIYQIIFWNQQFI